MTYIFKFYTTTNYLLVVQNKCTHAIISFTCSRIDMKFELYIDLSGKLGGRLH